MTFALQAVDRADLGVLLTLCGRFQPFGFGYDRSIHLVACWLPMLRLSSYR